jgi:hypothetical protein
LGGRRGRDLLAERARAALSAGHVPAFGRLFQAWQEALSSDSHLRYEIRRSRPVCELRRRYWGLIVRGVEASIPRDRHWRQPALETARRLLVHCGRTNPPSLRTLARARALPSPFEDPLWGIWPEDMFSARVKAGATDRAATVWLDIEPEDCALRSLEARSLVQIRPETPVAAALTDLFLLWRRALSGLSTEAQAELASERGTPITKIRDLVLGRLAPQQRRAFHVLESQVFGPALPVAPVLRKGKGRPKRK